MPEIVSCPQCERKLRIPDELLGKNVKCPSCGTTFQAAATGGMGSEPPPREDSVQPKSSAPLPPPRQYEEDPYAPRRESAAYQADDQDFERRPSRYGSRPGAAEVASMVKPPAICLLVVSILFLVGFPIYMLFQIILFANMRGRVPDEALGQFAMQSCFGGIAFIINIFIMIGAVMMLKMRAYGLAMTGAIMAVIPCLTFFCLGIPFGIWSLVILSKPEVKEAFH